MDNHQSHQSQQAEEKRMNQKPVLGKGLASLLPQARQEAPSAGSFGSSTVSPAPANGAAENKDRVQAITLASIEDIKANPFQPRREFEPSALAELAASIKISGVIQPLIVRKLANGFELIAGERRLRASALAGLKHVPVVVRKSTDKESLEMALVENIQRQDLNCIDEALAYQQLMEEFNLSAELVAERVGKDRTTVSNVVRLLKLPEAVRVDLRNGVLSLGHGKVLLSLEDHDSRLRLRNEVLEHKLSVRECEERAKEIRENAKPRSPDHLGTQGAPQASGASAGSAAVQGRLNQISKDLGSLWETKVEVKGNAKRGKITLHYVTKDEFERIYERLAK